MYETDMTIDLRTGSDDTCIIEVQGGLTAMAEKDLMAAFEKASEEGAQAIVFDFNELTYLNSAGIGLLVRLVIRANRTNQRIIAFGLQDHYRRIFKLTRLEEVIAVYETEAEALAAVSTVSS